MPRGVETEKRTCHEPQPGGDEKRKIEVTEKHRFIGFLGSDAREYKWDQIVRNIRRINPSAVFMNRRSSEIAHLNAIWEDQDYIILPDWLSSETVKPSGYRIGKDGFRYAIYGKGDLK